ncbi:MULTISPECIES: hypothetical protein [Bacillus]|uniref:hypothetical protein n=1 Tax=Bacillus TaxID=1386 RepID=UPI00148F38BB|nr:hypothetical protein [Bacillus paranthracis]MCC2500780.1 hypothetical protein [Bacillus paranthracis]MDF9580744.1 hypothetical protein [Bacillus paranthracis]MDG1613661.1 hypothetical protein [Bacillus paranthracis]NOP83094.1 hypothetical protein [Bacillus paranthracis]
MDKREIVSLLVEYDCLLGEIYAKFDEIGFELKFIDEAEVYKIIQKISGEHLYIIEFLDSYRNGTMTSEEVVEQLFFDTEGIDINEIDLVGELLDMYKRLHEPLNKAHEQGLQADIDLFSDVEYMIAVALTYDIQNETLLENLGNSVYDFACGDMTKEEFYKYWIAENEHRSDNTVIYR